MMMMRWRAVAMTTAKIIGRDREATNIDGNSDYQQTQATDKMKGKNIDDNKLVVGGGGEEEEQQRANPLLITIMGSILQYYYDVTMYQQYK